MEIYGIMNHCEGLGTGIWDECVKLTANAMCIN